MVIKCSKCKRPYHLRAWLKKHEGSCQGKRPKNRGKTWLSEHQEKTRTVLSSLGCEEFFSEKRVPSLVTSLQKISSTGAETAGIRGSKFISAQLQAEKLMYQLQKEEQVTSFFLQQSLVDHLLAASSETLGQSVGPGEKARQKFS